MRELTKHFPPKDLERINPASTLTIIGCGEPAAIAGYKQRTGTSFPIYCDPTRKLYIKLGMTSSLNLGDKKPSYVQSSLLGGTLKSIEERLPFRHFVRVHRSYIVNLHRVEAMEDNMLQLGQYEVPISRSYHEELMGRLQAL